MPLNLPRRGAMGDFISALRWTAKVGAWSTWDDAIKEVVEVSDWSAVADFANIRTCWARFSAGTPPDFVWDVDGKAAPKPSADHRCGFSLYLLGREGFEGARELCTTIGGVIAAIVELYDQYEAAPERAGGLPPIIQAADVKPVETNFGSFYDPVLELVDWEKRPQGLPVPPAPPAKAVSTALIPGLGKDDLDDEIPF